MEMLLTNATAVFERLDDSIQIKHTVSRSISKTILFRRLPSRLRRGRISIVPHDSRYLIVSELTSDLPWYVVGLIVWTGANLLVDFSSEGFGRLSTWMIGSLLLVARGLFDGSFWPIRKRPFIVRETLGLIHKHYVSAYNLNAIERFVIVGLARLERRAFVLYFGQESIIEIDKISNTQVRIVAQGTKNTLQQMAQEFNKIGFNVDLVSDEIQAQESFFIEIKPDVAAISSLLANVAKRLGTDEDTKIGIQGF